jgi:hypothetical protein
MTKTFVVSGSDCRLLKRRQYFIALRPVVWLVSTKQEFFACFWMCVILFLFVFYRVQVSMSFRQWSNIFLADQDERQRCFFADQKQFPADHWSLIGRYFEPCLVVFGIIRLIPRESCNCRPSSSNCILVWHRDLKLTEWTFNHFRVEKGLAVNVHFG